MARAPHRTGPARRVGAALAFVCLTLALPTACSPASGNEKVQDPEPKVTRPATKPIPFDGEAAWADMVRTVELGPRHPQSPALERTRMWIEEEARRLDLTPTRETFTQKVPVTEFSPKGELEYANVLVTIEAEVPEGEKPAPIVYIAGHIDTKFQGPRFVGANDGGSSFGMVMELMRGIAASGPRPVTYRFAFFDGEESLRRTWDEPNNTFGSRHHALQLKLNGDLSRVAAFVLLDMVAEKGVQLNWDLNSTSWLRELFWGEARALSLEKHVTRARGSFISDDHLPFKSLKIPVIDLIDLEYGGIRRPYWHTTEDTLDKCEAASMQIVGDIVVATLPKLEAEVLVREGR